MNFVSLPQWQMCRDQMESSCSRPRQAEAFGHLGSSPGAGSASEPVVQQGSQGRYWGWERPVSRLRSHGIRNRRFLTSPAAEVSLRQVQVLV